MESWFLERVSWVLLYDLMNDLSLPERQKRPSEPMSLSSLQLVNVVRVQLSRRVRLKYRSLHPLYIFTSKVFTSI